MFRIRQLQLLFINPISDQPHKMRSYYPYIIIYVRETLQCYSVGEQIRCKILLRERSSPAPCRSFVLGDLQVAASTQYYELIGLSWALNQPPVTILRYIYVLFHCVPMNSAKHAISVYLKVALVDTAVYA